MHWSLLRSSPTLKDEWELLPLRPSFPSKLSLNFHPCSCKWLNVLFFRVASLCWPAHFIFLLHRSCISSHAELGLVVEPISLCIHEMFSLRESVWLCATLGISVKGLHLQCLWCSQLFAPFVRGWGGSHCGTWRSAAGRARRNCSGTDNELAQFAEVSLATEKGKLDWQRAALQTGSLIWTVSMKWFFTRDRERWWQLISGLWAWAMKRLPPVLSKARLRFF